MTCPKVEIDTGLDASDFEDKLFDLLSENDGKLAAGKFKSMLLLTGLRESDPRLKECMQNFVDLQVEAGQHDYYDNLRLDRETFKHRFTIQTLLPEKEGGWINEAPLCVNKNIVLISKAFKNLFVIPDFPEFRKRIDNIYHNSKSNKNGQVASYIPQLARYNPEHWAVSVCTTDGQRHSIGDTTVSFCLQSVCKPLVYALALNELGPDIVHQYVGHEPSGQSFNTICLDRDDKPHNPMINSGAIVTSSLIKQGFNSADKFDYAINMFRSMAGGEFMAFNNAVYLSEKETADRNFALGYYMREKKCFPEGTNLTNVIDFYFQLCSVEVNSDSGAVIAATLANGGVCPITGNKLLSTEAVRDTLSLMHSCGMYDYSGQFAFKVGLPAKSGVSGCVIMVVPNVMGLCMWSPPLDVWGNSCRAGEFCEEFIKSFNFHNFDIVNQSTSDKNDPRVSHIEMQTTDIVKLLFGAYNGDVTALRRYALLGLNMNQQDYDGRTALHIAAAEGHLNVVNFLLKKCKADPYITDRWGYLPLDEAKKFNHDKVAEVLGKYKLQQLKQK